MQFDNVTAKPLRLGKLYFFAANTSTPQNAYQDVGLTIAHPNPITLDGSGRIPAFYLADGSIRVRLLNASGVQQFDVANLLVIGPSAAGGGGGSVDPTTIFQTGDVMWLDQAGTRSGWVRDNGRTIGSSTSGASERANADCLALYAFIYGAYPDTVCAVNGGRGASAAADFALNKWITLPDKRGRMCGGLDDMGNTAASRLTGVTFTYGNTITAGSLGGEGVHTLTIAETPVITPAGTIGGSQVLTGLDTGAQGSSAGSGGGFAVPANTIDTRTVNGSSFTFTGTSHGGGTSHNNMPPFALGTFYRKL